MGKWKKAKRKAPRGQEEPLASRVAILLALLNVFIWVGFRGVDIVVLSFASSFVGLIGFLLAFVGGRAERRRRGSLGRSALTEIGYWGNLALFLGSSVLFSYTLAIGILRGDFI